MNNSTIKQRFLKYNTPRRIIQLLSFVFFSALVFNVIALPLLFPVLWTWGYNANTVGDAFTAIQLGFTGWPDLPVAFPWFGFASFLIVGILIGKSLCGWICPFGFVQDLVGSIKREQTDLSVRNHGTMKYAKYLVLVITLFIVATFSASKALGTESGYYKALGIFAQAPFTALSPSETIFATLPRIVAGFTSSPSLDIGALSALFWVQIIIMIGVIIFALFVPRSWCRYFCPHGAIMAILNHFSFIGLQREPFSCAKGGCRLCVQVCPMRVPILDSPWEKFSDPECIYCMKCVDACPHEAIKLKYP